MASDQELSFTPVAKPARAYEMIVDQIENAILTGKLTPGARLPSERELMAQFAVGRATVREALRVLEARGMIRGRGPNPSGGAEVLPFSTESLHKALTSMIALEQLDLPALVQFRMVIEGNVAALSAQLRSEESLATIEAKLTAMHDALNRGYDAFAAADVDFHKAINASISNPLLTVCNEVARGVTIKLSELRSARRTDPEQFQAHQYRRHQQMYEAIRDRKPVAALRAARDHLYESFEEFLDEEQRAQLRPLVQATGEI
ncbi:MAG TPA: GntR family transcriptional regulator [Amycolatopsis sp.]|jgi:DNA-binding FadR family transcriptional regulator|nr:GntR family transcriptional regulator [Amycolatopsis sp.]